MTVVQKSKQETVTITTENLPFIAGLNGYPRIALLADKIGRTREAIHMAVANPTRYPRTWVLINEALTTRRLP